MIGMQGGFRTLLAITGLLCIFSGPAAIAQHATASDVFSGEQTFQSYCANCHGAVGNQIANVDLGHGVFRKPYADGDLVDILLRGIPGTPMPATPNLTREQAIQIVAYLRSRAVSKDMAAGGDAPRGRVLFAGKGQCLSCHRVQGEGSRVGPDLSRIGLLRTADQLGASLLEPDREVQPNNRWYGVTDRDGEHIKGRLLNQDAYSVQLLDEQERLRSFSRRELRSAGFLPSPMPSVRGILNDQELADIVQYLASLRASARP
jgi:putative heme-binding domain-containing protein